MTLDERALAFRALGDPTRLRVIEYLLDCADSEGLAFEDDGGVRPFDGKTVGEVCCSVTGSETVSSTLSFHLKELRHAGLIETRKRGRHVLCAPVRERIAELQNSLPLASSSPTPSLNEIPS